jgi:hypothetical protein
MAVDDGGDDEGEGDGDDEGANHRRREASSPGLLVMRRKY